MIFEERKYKDILPMGCGLDSLGRVYLLEERFRKAIDGFAQKRLKHYTKLLGR